MTCWQIKAWGDSLLSGVNTLSYARIIMLVFGLLLLPHLIVGCAAKSEDPIIAIAPGDYARAFTTTRDVLREARYEITRVDAGAGLIETAPRQSPGLFRPWDADQTTLNQEFLDTINTQSRRVRVLFERAEPEQEPRAARVEVFVLREHRPGWQIETESIRTSRFSRDPALAARGMTPSYQTTLARDDLFAARLAQRIRKRLADDSSGDQNPSKNRSDIHAGSVKMMP